jgi:hypothetical protein
VAQTMCTHVSKCKKDKIKKEDTLSWIILCIDHILLYNRKPAYLSSLALSPKFISSLKALIFVSSVNLLSHLGKDSTFNSKCKS